MNAIVHGPRARLPRRSFALSALAAWLVACGGGDRSAPQPLLPPLPPAARATSEPATSEPASAAQAFAESGLEHAFTDPDRRKKLESAFPAIEALALAEVAAQKLPGAVFGVVVDGDLAYAKGFGVTDLETKAKPDADTIYRLGSITKSFTALAVLALRDDGALALDEPLTRLLPEASGLVYPTRDTPPITLRQLLTHSSGLPRLGHFDYTRQGHALSEEEIMKSLSGFALESPPGTRYHYSNLGYGLLGIAVGRASRASVRAVVGEKILQPLGMTSTGWDRAGVPAARIAAPYKRGKSGALEPTFTWELGASEGAGGLYSSLRDAARYVAFQLSAYPPRSAPEAAPIRRSSIREAHFNALRSGGLRVRQREAPSPGESTVAATASSYAYAWGVSETCEIDRVVRHNGAVAGFSAAVSFLPERGVGIVALTNLAGDGVDLERVVTKALLALEKTGGLAKRVPQMKALSPALALALDEKSDEVVKRYAITPRDPGPCPVQ